MNKIKTKAQKIFLYKRFCLAICGVLLVTQFAAPRVQAAPTVLYTALGDSIGFGLFAPIGDGYVPTFERLIEADTGVNVNVINLSVPGWTSSDLRGAIRGNLLFRLSVATSTIVTVNIGGNDLLGSRRAYKVGLLSFDNLHPNRRGHRRIADLLRGLGYSPFVL